MVRKSAGADEYNVIDQRSLSVGDEAQGHKSNNAHVEGEDAQACLTTVKHEETAYTAPEISRPVSGVQGLLAGIFSQLEAAQAEASDRVAKLQEELATAERDEQAICVLLQIRKGNLPTSFAPADHQSRQRAEPRFKQSSQPRQPKGAGGALQEKILSVLTHNGLGAGAIIEAMMVKGNKLEENRVRQQLMAMKKAQSVGYSEQTRLYSKPA